MRRRTLYVLCAGLFVVLGLGSDSPKAYDDTVQFDDLEGTWQLVEQETNGRLVSIDLDLGFHIIFRQGEFTWTGLGPNPKGVYKVVSGKNPGWVDQTTMNGPPRGNYTSKGIYRIDGEILKLAWNRKTYARPPSFDTKEDQSLLVETFKRVRK